MKMNDLPERRASIRRSCLIWNADGDNIATMSFVRELLNNQTRNTSSENFSKLRLTSFGVQSIALIQELSGLKFYSCDVKKMMFP